MVWVNVFKEQTCWWVRAVPTMRSLNTAQLVLQSSLNEWTQVTIQSQPKNLPAADALDEAQTPLPSQSHFCWLVRNLPTEQSAIGWQNCF